MIFACRYCPSHNTTAPATCSYSIAESCSSWWELLPILACTSKLLRTSSACSRVHRWWNTHHLTLSTNRSHQQCATIQAQTRVPNSNHQSSPWASFEGSGCEGILGSAILTCRRKLEHLIRYCCLGEEWLLGSVGRSCLEPFSEASSNMLHTPSTIFGYNTFAGIVNAVVRRRRSCLSEVPSKYDWALVIQPSMRLHNFLGD